MKPSTYASEIQQRLILDGVVNPGDVPCLTSIKKCIRSDLVSCC